MRKIHPKASIEARLNRLLTPTTNRPALGWLNESTRSNWLEEALKQIPVGSRILDAGAGEQQFRRFCEHLNYVAQDFAQYDGQGDGTGLQTGEWKQTDLDIVSDIAAIPEPDASFDAILCVEVFEHLPSPLLALKEFARLLRSGGQLIVTAPFCSLTHFAPYHFYTGFNRYFYETHFPAHGFEIAEITPNGNYFEYLIQELQRLPLISRQYSEDEPKGLEKYQLETVLKMLERFSRKDSGSAEVLHFGYNVRAVKR